MLSLALINTGAAGQGRNLLRQRVARLDHGGQNSAPRWYHLAECRFWLGERKRAVKCMVQAVQHWPEDRVEAPVQGLHRLISFSISRSPATKAEAIQWLETAVEDFYQESDIEHAMDAKEYMALLEALETSDEFPPGLKLLGMSFAR